MGKRPRNSSTSSPNTGAQKAGNYVSEWFGYRIFPVVSGAEEMMEVQRTQRCPFLSNALGEPTECIKKPASKGVCTINTVSGGFQDQWLVCPYRAVQSDLMEGAARRLFKISPEVSVTIIPTPSLATPSVQSAVIAALGLGGRAFAFFQDKLGGEISLPGTEQSPEFSFDITLVEIIPIGERLGIGNYGILEIQTMDFHGSYGAAVRNLTDALRLHKTKFPEAITDHPHWLSESMEGPNLANVFKRTFYQMVFKFQLGLDKSCAGCELALPTSVWESWEPHLGKPTLRENADGTFTLEKPIHAEPPVIPAEISPAKAGAIQVNQPTGELSAPAWINVFEIEPEASVSPNRIATRKLIRTDAHSFAYYALDVAPAAAVANAAEVIRATIARRLAKVWSAFSV